MMEYIENKDDSNRVSCIRYLCYHYGHEHLVIVGFN